MPADPSNLASRQGEDFAVVTTMVANGSISAWTLTWTVRNSSGVAELTLTVGSGITITTAGSATAPGAFTTTFTAARTAALSIGLHQWDVWRTNSGSAALIAYGSHVILGVGSSPFTLLGAYATPLDLITRHDFRDVADWASDTGSALTRAQILAPDPNVVAALLDASGDVEMACLTGERYSPADLAALTGASQSSLKRIVCDIAAYNLATRRIPKPEIDGYEKAMLKLEALENGRMIFGLIANAQAGQADTIDLITDQYGREKRVTEMNSRLFGNRMDNRLDGN